MTETTNALSSYLAEVSHRGRTMLLPALHVAQDIHGWLSAETQKEISEALRVPEAEIHGVIEFYTMFYNEPTAKRVVRICDGPACELNSAQAVLEASEKHLGIKNGESTEDLKVSFEHVPCLGMCEFAPVGLNDADAAGELTSKNVNNFFDGNLSRPAAKIFGNELSMLSRVGKVDPTELNSYEELGGFAGLRKATKQDPNEVISLVESLNILGRGGAQFPTGSKWRMTRAVDLPGEEKHIVVNADESEPGTFKDRVLMEEDPFSVIEAAILAGYAVGAENGWIFVRGEYPDSYQRLENAVQQARSKGYLGKNIFDIDGLNFDIELRKGAGAYICGEETALFEAIEGKRGFPRMKPPFPTTHGLFNQPTVVNNVETLVAVLSAINMGAERWNALGTKQSPGTKLFCISGNVENAGLYEYPFGYSIGELIEMAGGVPNNKNIQGVLLGGAAGIFVGSDKLDVKLTYEDAKDHGIPIGSGVIMVFDEDAEMMPILNNLARFFAHESCGKCFPCQLGTQRQMEILTLAGGRSSLSRSEIVDLADIGFAMTETSICGLGQTASTAIQSAIKLWPELVE
jgi:NADH-quinone oxidoreductase subunit F